MRLFYSPDIELTNALSEDESKHAVKVLRLKVGDKLEVLDGKGNSYIAVITEANAKKCAVSIESKQIHQESPYYLEIIISPTKNSDRMEWFIEKAIEIGVSKISFVLTERSERKKIRLDRFEKIAVSAMKQSKHYHLTELSELTSFDSIVNSNFDGDRFIAHCLEDNKQHLKDVAKTKSNCQILIGPEGDFTTDEIDLALSKKFKAVSLGESRLRTETAGIYACTALSIINT